MKTSGKIAVAALAGAAVGAALGVLFAPAKGSETRKKISDKTKEAKDKISDLADRTKDSIKSQAEKGKEMVKEKMNGELDKA